MKKLLLLSALITFTYLAQAQTTASNTPAAGAMTYKAFKVDMDFGYAIPSAGTGTKAGATFTIEPHYRLSDAFALGIRFEGAGLGYENQTGTTTHIKVSLLTSYCLTGDYYFSKGGFRVFAGGGAGLFTQKSESATTGEGAVVAGGTKFGVFPRIGFEAGHFRMSGAYDILGNNASYLAFTIGFFFGGGKK
jgi:hypothetical protein